jgi:geranylgeranyl pyrophosphate synthase
VTTSERVDLATYLDELRTVVNDALTRVFAASDAPPLIVDAMNYALLGGGKRLRPCLTLAAAEAIAARDGHSVQAARSAALANACAIEMVHSYSLVHDDLPAMDDDTLRRGRPTAHVIFGDGIAVLAGDGLLTEAFAIVAAERAGIAAEQTPAIPAVARLRSSQILAAAAGAAGMVGGQTIDLAAAGRVPADRAQRLDGPALEDMHARKTGALIRAAVVLGGVAAGAAAQTLDALDRFARELGLTFQIVDDLLDIEGSAAELGKTAGKDAATHKVTYPALYGIDRSRQLAAECIARAKTILDDALMSGRLTEIADWSLTRRQ